MQILHRLRVFFDVLVKQEIACKLIRWEMIIYTRIVILLTKARMQEDQCGWLFKHMDNNNILIVSHR